MERIGMIGMGLMGQAFIKTLHNSNFIVQGYDVDGLRMDQLAEAGGVPVDTPAAVARDVRCVIISLPTSDITKEVLLGGGGVAEGSPRGLYICDTTTSLPEHSESLHTLLKEYGIHYLDSAVSGTSVMAQAGDLVVISGGDEGDFEACRHYFSGFSRAAYYLGPAGSGARTKLIINLILAGNRLALAEGLIMAEKIGLQTADLLDVLQDSACASKTMVDKGPKMINADYSKQGQVQWSLKDSRLMIDMGQKVGAPTMMIQLYSQIMQAAYEKGYGERDTVAFYEILRGMAGLDEQTP
ncbi:MAG: hypothetical protein CMM45_09315 [Rhodospirillaceae bacterium]|nr:hypothetical protein [Rhodospirillaceae bacterium]